MNEQIMKFIDLAKQHTYVKYAKNLIGNTFYDLFHQEFANLIIQECINKIETYRVPVGNSCAGELAAEWTIDALREIRDKIKEYFGVE